ncbi:hypothetical protein WISP_80188 [Willisornis vidua]|uniref:Endonuclease/exonuclease/phosphatase domain-containing protein n=1 Tax=Willisornis vidua TaxID=1566151 RepID=A0ABQ9D983_9PASS|nr:hypothetical protein WISP_80188 [Willisornis vidua]
MLDTMDSGCPERRSALIAHELSWLNIDIAALSEVLLHKEGSLKEHGAGYTLYWSGNPKNERHLSGVGFMTKNSIASKLENLLTDNPAEKDKFYTHLCHLTQKLPADDKIIILGDFNARVGRVSSIEAMLMRTQLRWARHISRMEDHRLLKIVLYGELTTSCHKRGAPKKRYKDSLKQHLSLDHIDCH